ncbi:MAG: HAD family hydrolase [Sandaracinus sp.]|nr:HAD family hydrolase [Sandaracinus sp.]|tara:strand:- start:1 stop:801 length:801 start_codon:yes stop_codon:yes gene_type:complete
MSDRLRPLDALSGDALRGLEGVVFDVDDTLTRGGLLEPEAFVAMHSLANAGLRLWAVTGRPLGWAQVFAAQWPVRGAVGENGAGWWWREGEALHRGYFEGDEATRETQRRALERVLHRVRNELPGMKLASDRAGRSHDLAYDVGEAEHVPRAEVDRLVALIESEGCHALVSSVHCHAVPGDWDKAQGAERALGARDGVSPANVRERYLFVGDSPNDAAAFAHFPLSVGVANVRAHLGRLPTAPAYVTEADRGRGFAELAERILEAR